MNGMESGIVKCLCKLPPVSSELRHGKEDESYYIRGDCIYIYRGTEPFYLVTTQGPPGSCRYMMS